MMLSNKISSLVNILAVIILFISCSKSEPSAVQKDSFIKNFGGAYEDEAIDIIKDNSNYYILGNIRDGEDNTKIYLTKTDEFGNRLWNSDKTFSPDAKQTKAGQIIKLNHQPGFAIIGAIEVDTDSLYFDTYIIIIDENGEIISENIYSNPYYNDYGKCIGELNNGGFTISSYAVATQTNASYTNLITASSTGEKIQSSIAFAESEPFQICEKNNSDGFYVTAYNRANTYPFIIIIGVEGTTYWSYKPDGINGQIKSITQDLNGNTFICGQLTNGENGGDDGFIAQIDVDESIFYKWLSPFGKSKTDGFEHLTLTKNNEILVTGFIENPNLGTSDLWIVKTNITGDFISESIIGGNNNEYGVRILESDENRFVIEGTTYFENNSMISIFKSEMK